MAPIQFNTSKVVYTPSYYLLQMFGNNRGEWLLKADTKTYSKPLVHAGRAGVELFDNSYEITKVSLDDRAVTAGSVRNGGWVIDNGRLIPDANRWNYLLLGKDTTAYNYILSAQIRRTKGSGGILFRLRDIGRPEGQNDFIGWNIGTGASELFRQAGPVKDTLCSPLDFTIENHRWYSLRMECKDDRIRCFIDNHLVHEVTLPPIPSLASVATLDSTNHKLIIKVVNTTLHEERTALNIHGLSVKNEATVIQMAGEPEARNSFDKPAAIVPEERQITFSIQRPIIYVFPAQSVTILKLMINN